MTRIHPFAAGALALPLLLAGCSGSVNLTTSPETIEEQAAQALQNQVGSEEAPGMDCGDESIDVVDGTVVDCILTDPADGTEYDSTVTISDVEGTNFHISVEVSEQPRG